MKRVTITSGLFAICAPPRARDPDIYCMCDAHTCTNELHHPEYSVFPTTHLTTFGLWTGQLASLQYLNPLGSTSPTNQLTTLSVSLSVSLHSTLFDGHVSDVMISRFVHGVPRVQDKTLQQLESGGFGLRTYIAYGIDPRCLWTVFVVCPSMGLSRASSSHKIFS